MKFKISYGGGKQSFFNAEVIINSVILTFLQECNKIPKFSYFFIFSIFFARNRFLINKNRYMKHLN